MSTVSYIGKGTVYLQVGNNPLMSIGNVSKLSVAVAEDRQDMTDYENAGGGIAESVSRVKSASLDMTAYSFSQTNLAQALRGTTGAVTATSVVAEPVTAAVGGLHVLAKLPDASVAMTVESAVGATTFVEGTDYVRTRSGFTIPVGSAITDGTALTVDYKSLAGDALQALTNGAVDVRLVFEGLNEARSGKAIVAEFFRVQFSPTKALDLIGDKFSELQLTGMILKDSTKTGAGLSQYMTVRTAA